eukprot:COSAG01_NODE_59260_length_301_cov_0.772277_1_plen_95_part_10
MKVPALDDTTCARLNGVEEAGVFELYHLRVTSVRIEILTCLRFPYGFESRCAQLFRRGAGTTQTTPTGCCSGETSPKIWTKQLVKITCPKFGTIW